MKNVTFIPGNYGLSICVLFCCNYLGYLGVCETLHRRSQSRCHLSQFHTVCPVLSQSLVFLMISDDFSFRTRMGPQVTSSTPIRIPRWPQMAPRCPQMPSLGSSWGPLGPPLASLGALLAPLGCLLAPLGRLLTPQMPSDGPKMASICPFKNALKTCAILQIPPKRPPGDLK